MITQKKEQDIVHLREGGRRLCEILGKLEQFAAPGVTTGEIDALAEKLVLENGDVPILKGYHPHFAEIPYPATTCISINDEVVHGIPENDREIKEGDIVGIDLSLEHEGLVVDSARTVPIGAVDDEGMKLIAAATEARSAGIKAAKPGNHVGDIGHAVEEVIKRYGFSIAADLCGHGVGYGVHEEPNVPNIGEPGTGPELLAGMVLAIEPMVNSGSEKVLHESNGYTVRTVDRGRSAHMEHTVLITEQGPEILTEC